MLVCQPTLSGSFILFCRDQSIPGVALPSPAQPINSFSSTISSHVGATTGAASPWPSFNQDLFTGVRSMGMESAPNPSHGLQPPVKCFYENHLHVKWGKKRRNHVVFELTNCPGSVVLSTANSLVCLRGSGENGSQWFPNWLPISNIKTCSEQPASLDSMSAFCLCTNTSIP